MIEPMLITIDDVICKKEICEKYVEHDKTCATCKHESSTENAFCSDCFNSFLSMPFPRPSKWEKRDE